MKQLLKTAFEIAMAVRENQPPALGNLDKVKIIYDAEADVEGFIGKSGDIIIIAFMGTESFRDVITDAKFWKKKIPYDNMNSNIRVHAGFIDAYKRDKVRGEIHRTIQEWGGASVYRIYGHSYGGALATLCAVDVQFNFSSEIALIIFGCPRVGNPAFSRSFNKRVPNVIRVINGSDLVTKLPPFWCFYKHIGGYYHIGKGDTFWNFLGHCLSDHLPKSYQNAIDSMPE